MCNGEISLQTEAFLKILNLLKLAFLSGIPGILSGVGFSDVEF